MSSLVDAHILIRMFSLLLMFFWFIGMIIFGILKKFSISIGEDTAVGIRLVGSYANLIGLFYIMIFYTSFKSLSIDMNLNTIIIIAISIISVILIVFFTTVVIVYRTVSSKKSKTWNKPSKKIHNNTNKQNSWYKKISSDYKIQLLLATINLIMLIAICILS